MQRAEICHAAARQQIAAKGAQPARALRFVVHGVPPTGPGNPGQRHAFVSRRADIHATLEQYAESQSRPAANIRHAQPATGAIRPFCQFIHCNLQRVASVTL